MLNAYLFIGIIEAGVAYLTFFVYYANKGVSPGQALFSFGSPSPDEDPNGAYGEMQNVGQCLYFYALVVMQFGNVLTSRTALLPTWRQNPFTGSTRNPRIFVAMGVSAVIVALTCYLPPIQNVLLTRCLPEDWLALLVPWVGAVFLISANELRKVIVERFPQSFVAKLAWK